MTALTWQALLLLALAYLAGCCIGCISRRAFGRRAGETPVAADAAGRLAPAVSSASEPIIPAVPKPSRRVIGLAAREPFRRADTIAARAKPEPMPAAGNVTQEAAGAVARFERALSGAGMEGPPSRWEPSPVAARPSDAVAQGDGEAAPDDLKLIKTIDEALEARLDALGVTSFAEIAQWSAADVAGMSRELGFKGRIQRENWVEQAQILAKGEKTAYAERLSRGEAAAARMVDDEGEQRPAPVPCELTPVSSRQEITEAEHAASDVRAPDQSGAPAAVHAVRAAEDKGPQVAELAAFGQPRRPEPDAVPREGAIQTEPERPAHNELEQRSVPIDTQPPFDQLQRIRGIDAEVEALLIDQDVRRYGQIADWTKADTARIDTLLGSEGRVTHENWIEQAQILAKGGDTAYSRDYDQRGGLADDGPKGRERLTSGLVADEPPMDTRPARSTEIASLRSVKSQALRSDIKAGGAVRDGIGKRVQRSGAPDDLKRIRGVGVLIEKKLNSMGVTQYEEIANWNAGDIDRVSRTLDFQGRIERENWVEQARILASGGQTEFSRRVDRGEVVTSRPR